MHFTVESAKLKQLFMQALCQIKSVKNTLQHIRTYNRGVSRGRNTGIEYMTGDLVAFPDDDCWYKRTTLEHIVNTFKSHPELDGVTGRFTSATGEVEGRWKKESSLINKYNVWNSAIAFSVFLKKNVVSKTGNCNQNLGVGPGTPWGAGEETDYLLRSLRQGFNILYSPDIVIFHPVKTAHFDSKAILRQRNYETGFAYVIRTNRYPFWYFPFTCMRTYAGITLFFFGRRPRQNKVQSIQLNWPHSGMAYLRSSRRLIGPSIDRKVFLSCSKSFIGCGERIE
jgi:glycosyltransferase involved in cell wall biosynthesis